MRPIGWHLPNRTPPARRLLGARRRGLRQALLDGVELRVRIAIAAHAAGIEHAQRGDRLETLVGLRRSQRVTTAAAQAQHVHARSVSDAAAVAWTRFSWASDLGRDRAARIRFLDSDLDFSFSWNPQPGPGARQRGQPKKFPKVID